MVSDQQAPNQTGWWMASAVVLVLGILGLMDMKNLSYSGFLATGGAAVSQVREDSPASRAGFEVGDRIVNNAGIDTDDLHAIFRQPRASIGETRDYVVERAGVAEPINMSVTFTELPMRIKRLNLGAALIGLAFLVSGVGAYLRYPSPSSRLLAFLGVAAMPVFIAQPYIPHADLRLAASIFPLVATLLIPALMWHFMLRFPCRRAFLDRKISGGLIYGLVAVGSLVGAVTLLLAPQLLSVAIAITSAVVVLQLLAAIGVLIYSYVKADSTVRVTHGLHVLLISFIVGLLPVLVVGFIPSLPGGQFYFLTTLLIPISLAYCVFKVAGHQPAALQPQLS